MRLSSDESKHANHVSINTVFEFKNVFARTKLNHNLRFNGYVDGLVLNDRWLHWLSDTSALVLVLPTLMPPAAT